ncbi:hypothetical protein KCU85_g2654, partial [Aureobasidium melanogenum]
MTPVAFTRTLFALLASCLIALVQSHTHFVWIVGLREGQTIEKHLDLVGRSIPIREHRPEINGYTASVSDDDSDLLKAIRSDDQVGFVVKMTEYYFRKTEKFIQDGWDEDDDDLYEHMTRPDHHWHNLQGNDPEIRVSDEGGIYSVRFADEEQEKKFCPLIQADPRVESFGPVRGYAMNDEIHDEL